MPGLQPRWTRKNIQHLPRFSIASPNADYAVYPRSAQAYADAGTSTWVNQKGYTTFAWIFTCVSKCWLCYISQKRSGIRGCRDFNLGEPERIYNICLDFHLRLKCWLCYISQKRSGIRGCRDFNLGEQERIYNICLDFQLRLQMLIMLYIPEALRHTRMPGLQPGWTRKDIKHLPGFSFTFQNADYVVHPRSAQAYADAGTSTWVNQKGYTTFAWIFICVLNADYVLYPRSAQAYADAGTSTWVNKKGYTTFA